MSDVCQLFLLGWGVNDIVDRIRDRYSIKLSREAPYRLVRQAFTQGYIRFIPPSSAKLAGQLQAKAPWLRTVSVVRTESRVLKGVSGVADPIAVRTAETVVTIIRQRPRVAESRIQVGFAGGYTMYKVAEQLSFGIRALEDDEIPAQLVLQAVGSAFQSQLPSNDPNAALLWFNERDFVARNHISFHCLYSTPFISCGAMETLRSQSLAATENKDHNSDASLRESIVAARELDIILTSAGSAEDEHSFIKNNEELRSVFLARGMKGSILWGPLDERGPIPMSPDTFDLRPVATVDPIDLPGFISRGKRVVLALSTCNRCGRNKGDILAMLLRMPQALITDVIVDEDSCEDALKRLA